MPDLTMGNVEARFAEMIWEREPVAAAELTKLCEHAFGWKRPTMYTVLRRLCAKGLFALEDGTVSALMTRDEYRAAQSEQSVNGAFGGSLPAFVAAFTARNRLTDEEADAIRKLIDDACREG